MQSSYEAIISFSAFGAAACIGFLIYMPRAVRIALILPLLFLGGLSFTFTIIPIAAEQRVTWYAWACFGMTFSEIVSALPYILRRRGKDGAP